MDASAITTTPAAPAAPVAPRGRRAWLAGGGVLTVVAVAIASLALWQWLGYPPEQRDMQHAAFPLSTPPGRATTIAIDATRALGDLTIRPGNGGEVTVTRELIWDRQRPDVDESWDGHTLRLDLDCPEDTRFYDVQCAVRHTIRVPADSTLEVRSWVGDVRIEDLRGDLTVQSDTGDVAVRSASGALTVQAGTGNLTLTGLTSADADLTLNTGDLRAVFTEPPRRTTAQVRFGSLELDLPDGDYRIDTDAPKVSRDPNLRQDDTAPSTVTARADYGEVRLR